MNRMEQVIRRGIAALNKVSRRPMPDRVTELSPLEVALETALGIRGTLTVVQVGANDGLINDPINRFICSHTENLNCLFIEPQEVPLRILQERHRSSGHFRYFHGALGVQGTLRLYAVSPSAWDAIRPRYARGWPDYRAPTGVTSTSRDQVVAWLGRYYKGGRGIDEITEMLEVPALPLTGILCEVGWPESIDVLQVDAEGADDEVLYASDLDRTCPSVINFEHSNLSDERLSSLMLYLRGLGYQFLPSQEDMLAIRGQRPGL